MMQRVHFNNWTNKYGLNRNDLDTSGGKKYSIKENAHIYSDNRLLMISNLRKTHRDESSARAEKKLDHLHLY